MKKNQTILYKNIQSPTPCPSPAGRGVMCIVN